MTSHEFTTDFEPRGHERQIAELMRVIDTIVVNPDRRVINQI